MDDAHSSLEEGTGAAISARVTEECNRILARELSGEEGKLYEVPARGAKVEGVDAPKQFKLREPCKETDL